MAHDSLPLKSCVFKRVSRRYEVAEARADRASCGFLIKRCREALFVRGEVRSESSRRTRRDKDGGSTISTPLNFCDNSCMCGGLRRPSDLCSSQGVAQRLTRRRPIAANRARYVVSPPLEGGRHPALGFYPIFVLSILTCTCAFWLRANVRARTGRSGGRWP